MDTCAISVENLGKRYRLGRRREGRGGYTTLRDELKDSARTAARRAWSGLRRLALGGAGPGTAAQEDFWALQGVGFQIRQGESVGIIGRNGAGKSTLLKVLSQITEPTTGRVKLRGRVASLLEVGTGFHPELTGRENIFLNGAILGMRRSEIRRKFDEIVDFAEVDKFLDTPVKRYSSGMYVRLAFAVAAHLEPEILLVDEVLAVGDAAFQKKCVGKMGEVATAGRTVIFVSHNMGIVRSFCSRCLLLSRGQLDMDGPADAVIQRHLGDGNTADTGGTACLRAHPNRLGGMSPVLTGLRLLNPAGQPCSNFCQSDPVVIEVSYDGSRLGEPLAGAGFILETALGVRVGGFNTYMAGPPPHRLPLAGVVRFQLRSPALLPGLHHVTVSVGAQQHQLVDKVEQALSFEILPDDLYGTGFLASAVLGVVALQCDTQIQPS